VTADRSAAAMLREHGEVVAARLVAENARRWVALSAGDRARVEALARTVAQRLLEEPAVRLAAAEAEGDDARIRVALELFGLGRESAGQTSRPLSA
jgi:glutamyl-tRNA reductase